MSAQEYAERHNLEGFLREALEGLLNTRPRDPMRWLAEASERAAAAEASERAAAAAKAEAAAAAADPYHLYVGPDSLDIERVHASDITPEEFREKCAAAQARRRARASPLPVGHCCHRRRRRVRGRVCIPGVYHGIPGARFNARGSWCGVPSAADSAVPMAGTLAAWFPWCWWGRWSRGQLHKCSALPWPSAPPWPGSG